jgi:tetratricopeptide (TPR) repeat protein
MSSASDHKSKAQTFFQYGNDAAMKNNFDYAIDMYQRACKIDIDNLLYRQALRGIERRKFGGDPKKVGRLVGTKNQPIRLRAKAHKAKKDWAGAIAVCEEAFVNNPWDVSAAWEAAEAAEQLGHLQLAQWLLESVYQQAIEAKEAEFFRYTAHVHELNESWQKAIQAWEHVKKMLPNDENANRQINALSAKATIKRSGLGEKIEKHEEAAPQGPTAEEIRAEKMTPEERWLKEIEEEPTRISAYLNLADHYKMRGQLDEAEKLLARGIKANPQDTNLKTEHSEIQMARITRFIEVQTKKIKDNPDDEEAKGKLAKATATLQEYEIKEYRRRIEVNPEDLGLHYQLGLRLAKAGKHDEAIASFQQARNSPNLKVQALHQMGLSFEAKGILKLAERALQDALKAAEPDDAATNNALRYRLGRIFEAQGNNAAAEEQYNEVAANDYSYLDVAQRLQNLSAG